MLKRIFGWCALALMAATTHAAADGCGGTYRVQAGDTLSIIAEALYENVEYWDELHAENMGLIGPDPNALRAGMRLQVACRDGLPLGLEAAEVPVRAAVQPVRAPDAPRPINLLAATGFAPFMDQNSLEGGLVTHVVRVAMGAAETPQGFAIHWVNDRSAHRAPLLDQALLDLGLAWLKPDCEAAPARQGCVDMLYSAPVFEMLMQLYVAEARPLRFERAGDLAGKRICRPEGFAVHMLAAEDGVELVRAETAAGCLQAVANGVADAAVLNEFTGAQLLAETGLGGQVVQAEGAPLSIESLHVVAHRAHPDAVAMLAAFDTGLARIRADGQFRQIVDAHLTRFWAGN